MMKMLKPISFVVVILMAICAPVFAHHGGASYDTSKTVTVKGTVTGVYLDESARSA